MCFHSSFLHSLCLVVPERKRESSAATLPPPKKVKVGVPVRPVALGVSTSSYSGAERGGSAPADVEAWEALAIECDPFELLENFINAANSGGNDKAVRNPYSYVYHY